MKTFLGIDTSNYTTSVAVGTRHDILHLRQLLPVAEGSRGIRQSDGVFHHMKQLPVLFHTLAQQMDCSTLCAVGVSNRPRNVEGSYMPVFLAGQGYAKVIADSLRIPLFEFSHQDGHVMAAVYSGKFEELLDGKPFLSLHLSGGTTELLHTAFTGSGFAHTLLGGTKDISAGQLIDRVGVKLGMRFPCGKELEQLAGRTTSPYPLPVSAKQNFVHFSGAETKAMQIIEAGKTKPEALALGVLEAIAESLVRIICFAVTQTGTKRLLLVGGVASNQYIRSRLEASKVAQLYLCTPEFATDNAAGIAVLADYAERNLKNGTKSGNSFPDEWVYKKDSGP